ncbi:MAG: hypothetical protein HGA85_06685 [Nanoarchaeota archaeon]|nr:hypothetical protein [Nanoarchaeota archaeon]
MKRWKLLRIAGYALSATGLAAMLVSPFIGILLSILAVLLQVIDRVHITRAILILGIAGIFLSSFLILSNNKGSKAVEDLPMSKVDPPGNVPEDNSGFRLDWGMVGVIIGMATTGFGWYQARRQRKETLKLMDSIDTIYKSNSAQKSKCAEDLEKEIAELKAEFEKDRINEVDFKLLLEKTQYYLDSLKKRPCKNRPIP